MLETRLSLTKHEVRLVLDFYDNLIATECARESTVNLDTLGSPSFDLEALGFVWHSSTSLVKLFFLENSFMSDFLDEAELFWKKKCLAK